MNRRDASQEFDPRIADWLEADPDHAPDPVLETVLAAFPSIPQRRASRAPRRFLTMNRPAILTAAAAIGVMLIGVLLVGRPSSQNVGAASSSSPETAPSPSASASAPATAVAAETLDRTFSSVQYGYSVDFPASWTVTPSRLAWRSGDDNPWGSGINDELTNSRARFSGAAQARAPGQTTEQWLDGYAAILRRSGTTGSPGDWPTISVDGHTAYLTVDGYQVPNAVVYDAIVVAGQYMYDFNMDGAVDRDTFGRFLATVKLPVIPTLDAAFTSPLERYSVRYPSSWAVTPATAVWKVDDYGNFDRQLVDIIGDSENFDGTSTLLAPGESFKAWYAAYDASRARTTCGLPPRQEPITIDGTAGFLDTHCPDQWMEAVTAKGNRVYVFTLWNAHSRPLFSSFLETVKLTPARAGT